MRKRKRLAWRFRFIRMMGMVFVDDIDKEICTNNSGNLICDGDAAPTKR